MWELDCKESWAPKSWCFWTVVLEKTLESPLDCKEIQPVHPKGNQSWVLIGRIDAEEETPILWLPDAKNCLFGKDPDAGNEWKQEEKETTEDEMVRWHHWLNGHDLSKLWELVIDREAWHATVHGVTKSQTRWATELNWTATQLVKESACNVGDLGSIPGLERSPEEGKGHSLQYSGLENSTGCIVHGIAKSRTWLSWHDWETFTLSYFISPRR